MKQEGSILREGFKKNVFSFKSKKTMDRTHSSCRKKLQRKFDECDNVQTSTPNSSKSYYNVFSTFKLDETTKVLRDGMDKISKTFTYVKTSLDTFSQRFKVSTRRRRILEETCMTPNALTPQTFSKRILGRTPTKLYSPFSIESPYNSTTVQKEPRVSKKV